MMFPPINSHFPFRLISLIIGHTKKSQQRHWHQWTHQEFTRPSFFYRLAFFRRLESLSNIMHIVNGNTSTLWDWKLEPKLSKENRGLAAATLCSIALDYVKYKVQQARKPCWELSATLPPQLRPPPPRYISKVIAGWHLMKSQTLF